MSHLVTIAGREVGLEWSNESSKRYTFRICSIGGEPIKDLSSKNGDIVAVALSKVLWALLPPHEFSKYPDAESLFVAVDHEKEGTGIYAAIRAIFEERFPSAEKKSTLKKSRSRRSS